MSSTSSRWKAHGDGWIDYEATLARHRAGRSTSPEIAETDLLTINYTSGTTSRPKGVMITHRNAYMNVVGTLVHHHLTPADRYLWTLPMFHANGWTFVWIDHGARRDACLPAPRRADSSIFQLDQGERITMLCAAPTVLIGIANAPGRVRGRRAARRAAAHRRRAAGGGDHRADRGRARLGDDACLRADRDVAVDHDLRAAARSTRSSRSAERAKIKARQGVELVTSGELLVVDENGNEVPHDGETLGEIVVRGNVVMKGYYNDPEATATAIRGGWFHTGDAAVVHPDGYAEIRDRIKDVIISGGENISSVEVEGVLLRHPAVQEVAVVGMPHERWGESPHAFVVLRKGATATEDELKQHVRDTIAHFKAPQWISFVEELPKTATGKMQKYVLRGGKAGISKQ